MKKKYKIIFPLIIVAGMLFSFQIANNPDPEKTPEKRNNPYLKIVYKYKGNDKNSDDSGVLPDKNNQVN